MSLQVIFVGVKTYKTRRIHKIMKLSINYVTLYVLYLSYCNYTINDNKNTSNVGVRYILT